MRCEHCAKKFGRNCWQRATSTAPGNGSAEFPRIGPIRAAVALGVLQTPHRFRTKRQLWSISGFAIETRSSADHRHVNGQLQKVKKRVSIRGLNQNHNHDLKNLFKGAAVIATNQHRPIPEVYTAMPGHGMRTEIATPTLATKNATTVLDVLKRRGSVHD